MLRAELEGALVTSKEDSQPAGLDLAIGRLTRVDAMPSILHRVRGPRGVRRVQVQGNKPNRAQS